MRFVHGTPTVEYWVARGHPQSSCTRRSGQAPKIGRLRCDEEGRARRREGGELARRLQARIQFELLYRRRDAEHGGADEVTLAAVDAKTPTDAPRALM
jgi:hypothetical protein